MKCLLVDDEPGIREGLAMLLRRRGYEVQTAADCAAAAAELAAQRFDVVVTDWRLPDGVAAKFAADCDCPVLAVSGHPEEVEKVGAIRDALAKPVRPAALLERVSELVEREAAGGGEVALAPDVQHVVDDALAQLPDDVEVSCHDDGTFVVLRATLPAGHTPTVRPLGGDLRVVESAGVRELELRLCRDGRPDPNTPVVAIDAAWPEAAALALDCSGTEATEETFSQWCAAVAERNSAGGRICLLNVPARLEPITTVWETTHDMPMRERVGPRLPAELTELWS